MKQIEELTKSAIELLKDLIAIQSYSGQEHQTADRIAEWLNNEDIKVHRKKNNVYAFNRNYQEGKPLLLLNSHHDTVKPNSAYTRDPFQAEVIDGKLFGLGSNDAGGPLVSLMACFAYWYELENLSHNIVLVASAEEENSGPNGLNSMLEILPPIDVAIVGEPTLLDLAIAEKGLVIFDAEVHGTPSHAAHPNDNNSIYNTIPVLEWFRNFSFPKVSPTLGEVKVTVTQINAGTQHNVVPAKVDLVIDVRVNDCYSNREIAEILEAEAPCNLKARSLRLNSSRIDPEHPLVLAGIAMGRNTYGSPTLSDQAALSCPSLKLGPGDSRRSHSADEYIFVEEIEKGIALYIAMLEKLLRA